MLHPYSPVLLPSGAVLQSSVAKAPRLAHSGRAGGLNVRGAIIKLYPRDTPPPGTSSPAATYASVLLYGLYRSTIPRVQIPQAFGSLHTGVVGGLRAATLSVNGGSITDVDHLDGATLDCTHVIVSFLDDDLSQPYISAVVEHPRADGGGPVSGPVEDRTRLASADGKPLLLRWNGIAVGITAAGDLLLDLENAYNGDLLEGGDEPPPGTNGAQGNARLRVAEGSKLVVTVGGQPAATFELSGPNAKLTLGAGAVSVAIAEKLQALHESVKASIDALRTEVATHTHLYVPAVVPAPVPVPTGAPTASIPPFSPAPTTPPWDLSIASTHLKIPTT